MGIRQAGQSRAGGDPAEWRQERPALLLVILAALLLRLPWLLTPGTTDMDTWKAWAYNTNRLGVTGIYTLIQPAPPLSVASIRQALAGEIRPAKVGYSGRAVFADYPPGTFYVLWAVAGAYRMVSPGFENRPLLNAAIKSPLVLADLWLALLLRGAVRRRRGPRLGLTACAAYLLNPAVILSGAVLAYLDGLYALPLVAGSIVMLQGRVRGLWAGLAGALAFKIQPLLLLPAVLALSLRRGLTRLLVDAATLGLILLVLGAPYILTGRTLALIAGMMGNAREEFISAYQANVWWLWTYSHRLAHGESPNAPIDLLWQSDIRKQGVGELAPIGLTAFLLFTALLLGLWLVRMAREAQSNRRLGSSREDYAPRNTLSLPEGGASYRTAPTEGGAIPQLATVAAVLLLAQQLYGATMLLTSVHENHLFGAVPLLALAAAWDSATGGRRPWLMWLLYGAASLIVGLNMMLFYGLGTGLPNPLPRLWFGIDGSVLLAAANTGLFVGCLLGWAWWALMPGVRSQGSGRNRV